MAEGGNESERASERVRKHMAELGLTCREAYTIFSQNETLRLQKENAELKQALKKFEFPKKLRDFCSSPDYHVGLDYLYNRLREFILEHVPPYIHENDYEDWRNDKVFDVFEEYGFGVTLLANFLSKHLHVLSGCWEFSDAQGALLAKHINQILIMNYALSEQHNGEMLTWDAHSRWLVDAWGLIYSQILITIGFDLFAAVEDSP